MNQISLYNRLGGYDGITAFVLLIIYFRVCRQISQLGRFWQNRGADGIARVKQLLIDYLCSSAGGGVYYTGRDMKTSHHGMGVSESDWNFFLHHTGATLEFCNIGQQECAEVVAYVLGLKNGIVEKS